MFVLPERAVGVWTLKILFARLRRVRAGAHGRNPKNVSSPLGSLHARGCWRTSTPVNLTALIRYGTTVPRNPGLATATPGSAKFRSHRRDAHKKGHPARHPVVLYSSRVSRASEEQQPPSLLAGSRWSHREYLFRHGRKCERRRKTARKLQSQRVRNPSFWFSSYSLEGVNREL